MFGKMFATITIRFIFSFLLFLFFSPVLLCPSGFITIHSAHFVPPVLLLYTAHGTIYIYARSIRPHSGTATTVRGWMFWRHFYRSPFPPRHTGETSLLEQYFFEFFEFFINIHHSVVALSLSLSTHNGFARTVLFRLPGTTKLTRQSSSSLSEKTKIRYVRLPVILEYRNSTLYIFILVRFFDDNCVLFISYRFPQHNHLIKIHQYNTVGWYSQRPITMSYLFHNFKCDNASQTFLS